jgi:hypothetical protein
MALALAMILLSMGLAYKAGVAAGLRQAPEHFAHKASIAASDAAFWERMDATFGQTDTCAAIYDLVADDLVGSEYAPGAVSPHSDER